MPRQELARFLRERRENLRPSDVGLPAGPRRRTPGLRREEVSGLANMSVDYYARLEQARGPRPSPRVLDAITSALRLDTAERTHLFRLAGATPTPPGGLASRVRPHVAELLRRMPEAGAIVTDATYTVIAWNPLAEALLGDLAQEPNLARRRFLHPETRAMSGREEFGRIAVSGCGPPACAIPATPGSPACWPSWAPEAPSSPRSGTRTRCTPRATGRRRSIIRWRGGCA